MLANALPPVGDEILHERVGSQESPADSRTSNDPLHFTVDPAERDFPRVIDPERGKTHQMLDAMRPGALHHKRGLLGHGLIQRTEIKDLVNVC